VIDLGAAQVVLEREVRRLYGVAEEAPLGELTEPLRSYVSYALGTVHRGRITLDELRPYCRLKGIRYLDAGCAYGGFLAAAAEAGAREVVGIELDERLVKIARSFLGATAIPHQIEHGDVTDSCLAARHGPFDLITCNDVVEHVASVPQCVESLASALAAGGCLAIAAPNRLSPQFIRADPHFQFFGIVLLPPPEAKRFQFLETGWPHYDVGDYFELDYHLGLLRDRGLGVEVINLPSGSARERVEALAVEFREIAVAGARFASPKIPQDLGDEVRRAVASAVGGFEARLARLRELESRGRGPDAASAASAIVRDYGVAVWHILARMPEKLRMRIATKLRRLLRGRAL